MIFRWTWLRRRRFSRLDSMRGLLSILLPVAAIAPVLVVLAYVLAFAHDSMSDRPSDWAEFGEYIGGTLGAFYGFLAFVGVLATIRIQQSQSNLDDLQRLMASESARLDTIFDSEPRQPDPLYRELRGNSGHTIYSLLELGTAAMISRDPKYTEEKRQERKDTAIRQMKFEMRILNVEVPQFVELLKQYRSAGGSQVVATHYENKYALPVGFMIALGELNSHSVSGYFRNSRSAMRLWHEWGLPVPEPYAPRLPVANEAQKGADGATA